MGTVNRFLINGIGISLGRRPSRFVSTYDVLISTSTYNGFRMYIVFEGNTPLFTLKLPGSSWSSYMSSRKIPWVPFESPSSQAMLSVRSTGMFGTKSKRPGRSSVLLSDRWFSLKGEKADCGSRDLTDCTDRHGIVWIADANIRRLYP